MRLCCPCCHQCFVISYIMKKAELDKVRAGIWKQRCVGKHINMPMSVHQCQCELMTKQKMQSQTYLTSLIKATPMLHSRRLIRCATCSLSFSLSASVWVAWLGYVLCVMLLGSWFLCSTVLFCLVLPTSPVFSLHPTGFLEWILSALASCQHDWIITKCYTPVRRQQLK